MDSNSHLSELSTSTQSSGYNSSETSSSLNFIDDQEHSKLAKLVDYNNNSEKIEDESLVTKLVITITLLKVDEDEEKVNLKYLKQNEVN